ncbi:MAG: glycosyltransferase family 2 protein [Ruminococcaceae bacterium]|nr:glycosyltransferase family 2 protein [Oscillospiraceae bacterium]
MRENAMISIIMPAYNAERYIEEAIRSVIDQTYTHWELLIIDDCSDDNTYAIAMEYAGKDSRISVYKNDKNMGVAATRNRGFDLCSGDYVALLDSDDVWETEKLKKQFEKLLKDKADIVYCSYSIVNGNGEKIKADYIVPEQTDFESMLKENVIGCSTVILSRDIADKYRFKTEYFHEDYVLWLDLLRDGYKAAGCAKSLVKWRYFEDSRSFNKRKSAFNRFKIYRNHLKFSLFKSMYLFICYMFAGIKKYF